MGDIHIRAATEQDYAQIVAIGRSATADYTLTVADLHHWDRTHAQNNICGRLVAVTANHELVGAASYGQSAPQADAQRFNVWLFVRPAFQGHGIGQRLYDRLLVELAPYYPRCLETGVRTDLPRAVRFLAERDFVEVMRECETHLDLTTFDSDKFKADLQRVEAAGISLKTLAELANDPARDAKLYELHRQRRAIGMEPGEPLSPFDEWRAHFWQLPNLVAEGFYVAVAGEQYVGQSNALASDTTEMSYGYTGVLPAYHNRGIARAMKVQILRWAKEQGDTLVRSYSDSRNEAMIRVNLHLGFVVQPAVLWMEKSMRENVS